ncbi:MAG: hypothetical protein IJI45_18475 [Anaerolineaceae bacterium]|nr:hypothetical protein [Anaerolineaceae bacterium]
MKIVYKIMAVVGAVGMVGAVGGYEQELYGFGCAILLVILAGIITIVGWKAGAER